MSQSVQDWQSRPTEPCLNSEPVGITELLLLARREPESRPVPAPQRVPAEVAAASSVASNHFEGYVRVRPLANGAMGEVWKAWDTRLGRWVALKFPRCETSPGLSRLKREAASLGNVTHPNVAAIYGFGQANGRHFIAMQYVDGVTLAEYPREDRRKLIAFVRYAALGVACAHAHGIVHRDLKPGNLMVDRAREQVYVVDFGIARAVNGDLHATEALGTPAYMPPEQARGQRVDGRSDVYSLAATLYELLADRPPFVGPNPVAVLRQVLEDDPKPLRHVDADLNAIILKGLEKDPARRYVGVAEFAEDLQRYLEGEPVRANPPGRGSRLRAWFSRRTCAALAGAIAALWLLAGAWIREREHRDDREREVRELMLLWSHVVLAKQGWYQAHHDPGRTRAEIEAAVGALSRYVEKQPRQPHGYYVRARGWLYLDDLQASRRDLEKAIEVEPEFGPAWGLLGRVKLEQYRATLRSEFTHKPRSDGSLLQEACLAFENARRVEAASGSARRWGLEQLGEEKVSETLARAMGLAYLDRNREAARKMLEAAHREAPSEEYCNILGLWAAEWAENAAWQTQALRIRPHYPTALIDRGLARSESGDRDGAIGDFTVALRIHSGLAEAYAHRAHAREGLGDYAGAIDDATAALRKDPALVGALGCRSLSKWRLGDRRGAVEDLTKAIRLSPRDASLLVYRGIARLDLGDAEGAADDFRRALDLSPGHSEAQRLLAEAKRRDIFQRR